ncbi:hypothetical protein [Phocoenobacter atlanticus]|nr:hypothetical protein [Pasteurella atlantica]MDP8143030.1 hypothetical protein [Pasteurella atlantica]
MLEMTSWVENYLESEGVKQNVAPAMDNVTHYVFTRRKKKSKGA